jgi:hypothetical protein
MKYILESANSWLVSQHAKSSIGNHWEDRAYASESPVAAPLMKKLNKVSSENFKDKERSLTS